MWPGSSTHHHSGAGRCVPDPHRQDRSKDYASSPSSAAQVGGSSVLKCYIPIKSAFFLIRFPDFSLFILDSRQPSTFNYFYSGSIITILIGMWLLVQIHDAVGNYQGSFPLQVFLLCLCFFFPPWWEWDGKGTECKKDLSNSWSS